MPFCNRSLPAFAATLVLGLSLTATALAGVAAEFAAPSVRVLFLDKLGARSAQKLLMAEGVRRVATYDPGRAVILADEPERIAELEDILRKADPGLLAKQPHAPLASPAEGSPEVERTFDTTDAKSGFVMLRAIYGIAELEPGRDGLSLRARSTQERLDAAESLLRTLGLLSGI